MSINVTLKKMPEIKFTGMSFTTDKVEEMAEKCPKIWLDFMTREAEVQKVNREFCLGVCKTLKKEDDKMSFEYFAAWPVTEHTGAPEGMKEETLPAAEYAVFEHKGSLENLGKTYCFIYNEWVKTAEYKPAAEYEFEYYDAKYNHENPDHPESTMYIYLPVVKK